MSDPPRTLVTVVPSPATPRATAGLWSPVLSAIAAVIDVGRALSANGSLIGKALTPAALMVQRLAGVELGGCVNEGVGTFKHTVGWDLVHLEVQQAPSPMLVPPPQIAAPR